MKPFIHFLLVLLCLCPFVQAQDKNAQDKAVVFSDLSVAVGSVSSSAVSVYRLHSFFFHKPLKVGYGIRLSGLFGNDIEYTSAPTRLAKDSNLLDTLNIESAQTLGLNAALYIEYELTKALSAGINIDVLGLGFGSKAKGRFISSNRGSLEESQQGNPTGINVLLVDTRDIGQLKSEFYVAYNFKSNWRLRAGFDMTFSEYTSDRELTEQNDRFRHIAKMGFVAFSYAL